MENYKYITELNENDFSQRVVILCITEDGKQSILICNDKEKTNPSSYETDNLTIKMDRVLQYNGKDFFLHIIESKKSDEYSRNQFNTIYEYIFRKITQPISSIQLFQLITSIEEYFRLSPEPNRIPLQIGVFGELLFVRYLYDAGYKEIVKKYHSNFFLKHDIEISQSMRVEIKTALGEKRIHHFKHNQIFRTDCDVYVGSVLLEKSQEGLTLYDLFKCVIGILVNPDSIFEMEKLMVRCGVSPEDKGLSIAEEKAINSIRIYRADELPHLVVNDLPGISSIEYDVDCSVSTDENVSDFIDMVKNC